MSALLATIGLPEIVAGLMVVALNAYVLMGGADFGGGLWDLVASGPRQREQRELIAESIAPIWEANHVWLIVVVVVLFTAFPPAYAMLATVLHIPLVVFLIGVVMRGSAFVFRSYGSSDQDARHRWGLIFAGASVISPLTLGVIIGAVSSGAAGAAANRLGSASFAEVFVRPWLAAYPLVLGLFALALFSFLAAVYLTVEAAHRPVQDDFRRRALMSGISVFVFAAIAFLLSRTEAPLVASGLTGAPWALVLHLCTALAAITALASLWSRRFALARMAAAAQVSFILWGWVMAQYPAIIPGALTIDQAAAPRVTLRLLVGGLAVGALILIPSLRYLFRTFGRPVSAHH